MTLAIIALFIAGILLVLAEFILPGGICGVMGGVLLLVSCGLGWYEYPQYGFWITIGEFFGAAGGVALGFYLFPRLGISKRMILSTEQRAEEGWVSDVSDLSLIGKLGTVFSPLRPAGTILIGDRRVDAVSTGELIDRDAAVRVLEVHGNRVVVEEATTD